MKSYLSFFIFLSVIFTSNSQELVLDTANVAYKAKISSNFEKLTLNGESAIDQIKDRKIRKELLLAYKEKQEDFRDLINKGIFIEHAVYSQRIQTIFEKIKRANPSSNFSDISLLLAISDEFNAYNYGDGIVVFNLPLVLEIENEMELAYIISHEISHQKLNHVYDSMLKRATKTNSEEFKQQTKRIEKEKYNKGKQAENLFKKLIYGNREESRKCEHEADSLGYILFKNTYPEKGFHALETLKKLKEIDNSDNDSLSKKDFRSFFEVNGVAFKDEWIASDLGDYVYQKQTKIWNVDSLRTHPDCDVRIDFLKKVFDIKEPSQKPAVSLQKSGNSDHEYVFGLYYLQDYGKSLYLTLLKLKDNPNDAFLKRMFYDNLLKIRNARNTLTLNKYVETENPKFSQDYNQVLCLLRNIRKNELNQIIDFYKN